MKRFFTTLVAALAIAALAGCGGSGGDSAGLTSGTTTGGTTTGGTTTGGTTTGGTTTTAGSLGTLTDIGDVLGLAGDAYYDTTTTDINLSGQIIGSSALFEIFWDPASPAAMTIVPGHLGAYDDFYKLKSTLSENDFETYETLEITDSGLVLGNSFSEKGESESRAFVWDSSSDSFLDLSAPSYNDATSGDRIFKNFSHAVDINASGEVVLTAEDKDGTWAYYWDGVSYDTIDNLKDETGITRAAVQVPSLRFAGAIIDETSSEAVAINDNSQMVGNSGGTAFYNDMNILGDITSLNYLSGTDPTVAIDINNAVPVGHVIGNSGSEGFFWDGGVMYPISNPSGDSVEVVDINDNDQVVGNSGGHAFIWTLNANGEGVFQDLGTLGGATSVAVAINDMGYVIGYSDTVNTYSEGNITATVQHAFLWYNGVMYDLGAHTAPDFSYPFDPNFYFSKATAINESGDVTGSSFSINAHHRGFTLTPPSPLP